MKVPVADGQGSTAPSSDKAAPVELIPLAGDGKAASRRDDVTGYVSEDSEPDFVDVKDIRPHSGECASSQRPEIFVNNVPASLNCDVTSKNATVRSSLKAPTTSDVSVRDKRSISFDLHDRKSYQVKAQVTIQQSDNVHLRHLFTKSRWSTSSSEDDTLTSKEGGKEPLLVQLNDITQNSTSLHPGDALLTKEGLRAAAVKKSYSLQPNFRRKRSTEDAQKKRRSTGDDVIGHNASLRDSAIDLVSDDDENSEVYTAVSLAGTLSRNMQPAVPFVKSRRKYVLIGVVAGFVVAAIIIVTLLVMLLTRH